MRRAASVLLRAAIVTAIGLAGGSCSDYLARRDTLTPGTGDAVQANIAVHVTDPWPRVASRTDTDMDGERLQRAIERYRNPSAGAGAGGGGGGAGSNGAAAASIGAPPVAR